MACLAPRATTQHHQPASVPRNAPGAIRKLQPSWKMTLEEAQEFGRLYGVCCVCAAPLTDEKSIAAGIGPVCAKKF